jgi:hypothetical protein
LITSNLHEQTPTNISANYGVQRPQMTPLHGDDHMPADHTPFVSVSEVSSPQRFARSLLTPVGAAFNDEAFSQPSSVELQDEVTRARTRRIELLVRQFDKETSIEDDARLLILTQKLRRLSPSVPDAAWADLSAATSALEQVSSDLDVIRAQFGIR